MAKKAAPIDLSDSFEKIPVKIFPSPGEGSVFVARQIADLIREKQKKKLKYNLKNKGNFIFNGIQIVILKLKRTILAIHNFKLHNNSKLYNNYKYKYYFYKYFKLINNYKYKCYCYYFCKIYKANY